MHAADAKPQRDIAIGLIRTAMIEKKMTQHELADAADCHEKTIQNMMNGRSVREQTLFDVCMVLGLDFEQVRAAWSGIKHNASSGEVAEVDLGAYSRTAVEHYIGRYVTLRPAFDSSGKIMSYVTEVSWDDDKKCLRFREQDRPERAYAHSGELYMPAGSMFVYLVSRTRGWMRLVVVSQLDPSNKMRGLITTLNKAMGSMYVPVSAPIVYVRPDKLADFEFGEIGPATRSHAVYKRLLDETIDQSYAKLVRA